MKFLFLSSVCLIIDAMSIRKQLIYDQHTKATIGYTDLGNGPQVEDREASEALVFMITGITYFVMSGFRI